MGFYLELRPAKKSSSPEEFIEQPPPATYWVLFLIGVFALVCMGLAAHQVLDGLFDQASMIDWVLLAILFFVVGLFLCVGFKMAFLRKFIRLRNGKLELGFYCVGIPLISKKWNFSEISEVVLYNHKPAPNLAPQHHTDPQYYIRGHWRVLLKSVSGKGYVLDKHVEMEALDPLFSWLRQSTHL